MHLLFATPEIAPFSNVDAVAGSISRLAAALRTYRPASHVANKAEAGDNPVESVAVVTPLHRGIDMSRRSISIDALEVLSSGFNGPPL